MVPHWSDSNGRENSSAPIGQRIQDTSTFRSTSQSSTGQANSPRELDWQIIGDRRRLSVQETSAPPLQQTGTSQDAEQPQSLRTDNEILASLNDWLARREEHAPQIALGIASSIPTQSHCSTSKAATVDPLQDGFSSSSDFGNGSSSLDLFQSEEYMPSTQLGQDIGVPHAADIHGFASHFEVMGEQADYKPSQDGYKFQPQEWLQAGTESVYLNHQPFSEQSALDLQDHGFDQAFECPAPVDPGHALEQAPTQEWGSYDHQQAMLDVQSSSLETQRNQKMLADQHYPSWENYHQRSLPQHQAAQMHTQQIPKPPNFNWTTGFAEDLSMPMTALHKPQHLQGSTIQSQALGAHLFTSQPLLQDTTPQQPRVSVNAPSPGRSVSQNQAEVGASTQPADTSASAPMQSARPQQNQSASTSVIEGLVKTQRKRRALKRYAFETEMMLQPSEDITTAIELLTEQDRRNAEIIPDTSWWSPTKDIKSDVPTTEWELYPYIETMKRSMMDTSQAKDKNEPGTSFHLRWSSGMLESKGFPASTKEMEALCFEIAKMAMRLHNEGPRFLRMHDQIQQNKIEKEQELTFTERISVIVTILLVSKARVDKLLKHENLGGLVAYPMDMLKNTLANRPYNDKRKVQNQRGKEVLVEDAAKAAENAKAMPADNDDQAAPAAADDQSAPATAEDQAAPAGVYDGAAPGETAVDDQTNVDHTKEGQEGGSEVVQAEEQEQGEQGESESEAEERNFSDNSECENYRDGKSSDDKSSDRNLGDDTGLGQYGSSDDADRANENRLEHQHESFANWRRLQTHPSHSGRERTRPPVPSTVSSLEVSSVSVPAISSAPPITAPSAYPSSAIQPAQSIGKCRRPATESLAPASPSVLKRPRDTSYAGSNNTLIFDKRGTSTNPTMAPPTKRRASKAEIEDTSTRQKSARTLDRQTIAPKRRPASS